MNKLRNALAPIVLLSASTAISADYTVQIGALNKPTRGYENAAQALTSVSTQVDKRGVTRYQAGRFDTQSSARAMRDRLRKAGYSDAFVTRAGSGYTAAPATKSMTMHRLDNFDYSGIPPDLRDRVVLLDGAPHVKEGDRFVPWAEFNRRRR